MGGREFRLGRGRRLLYAADHHLDDLDDAAADHIEHLDDLDDAADHHLDDGATSDDNSVHDTNDGAHEGEEQHDDDRAGNHDKAACPYHDEFTKKDNHYHCCTGHYRAAGDDSSVHDVNDSTHEGKEEHDHYYRHGADHATLNNHTFDTYNHDAQEPRLHRFKHWQHACARHWTNGRRRDCAGRLGPEAAHGLALRGAGGALAV